MQLINLTPHDMNIIRSDGGRLMIKSSGLARVAETSRIVGVVDGAPLKTLEHHDMQGLPEPKEGTLYIVSTICAQAAWKMGRLDVIYPIEFVREGGEIKGCRAFACNPAKGK